MSQSKSITCLVLNGNKTYWGPVVRLLRWTHGAQCRHLLGPQSAEAGDQCTFAKHSIDLGNVSRYSRVECSKGSMV